MDLDKINNLCSPYDANKWFDLMLEKDSYYTRKLTNKNFDKRRTQLFNRKRILLNDIWNRLLDRDGDRSKMKWFFDLAITLIPDGNKKNEWLLLLSSKLEHGQIDRIYYDNNKARLAGERLMKSFLEKNTVFIGAGHSGFQLMINYLGEDGYGNNRLVTSYGPTVTKLEDIDRIPLQTMLDRYRIINQPIESPIDNVVEEKNDSEKNDSEKKKGKTIISKIIKMRYDFAKREKRSPNILVLTQLDTDNLLDAILIPANNEIYGMAIRLGERSEVLFEDD